MNHFSRVDCQRCREESGWFAGHQIRDSLRRLPRALEIGISGFLLVLLPLSACGLGEQPLVEFVPSSGGFRLASGGAVAVIHVDDRDWPGVLRAAKDLQADIARVTGITPKLSQSEAAPGANVVMIGTIRKSRLVDRLIGEKKIDVSAVVGKREATLIQAVKEPMRGVESALVIAGSDRRGTIYGIYTLSEQMGVSPWYWWADVPVRRQDALFVKPGRHLQEPPAIKYRGIFLNDEAPALAGWAREKFGGFNHRFYTNVFELLLRLKANYLWPAMWDNSFATDDPLNAKLADEYGIVVGTSHHEPMMRAWKEWSRAGNGPRSWDYSKNDAKLRAFWEEGLRRTRDYEKIITLGMRGDGDEPMTETESVALLERIVADQRKIIGNIIDPHVEQVPQSWALYKEVQGYYARGMRVPDDVTLLWCDDNWGNLRRLPTLAEQCRSGGAGIYYHFDYVGGPRNYKWLNTVPLPKIWEQMNLAYHNNATRIWIVNVGDLKPMEVPIDFFLTFARDPKRWTQGDLGLYLRLWAMREFGPKHAAEIADLVAKYTKYNGRRKPELLEPGTFSLVNYDEADRVLVEWQTLADRAENISAQLPREAQNAFFELVLHPIKACGIVNELYIMAARNRLYARQRRASANDFAAKVRELFQADAELTEYFHRQLAGGKWNHMMSQTHIGYTNWQQPPLNLMPAVREIELPTAASLGVAVEGSAAAWPGADAFAVLPEFDAFNRPRRYIDIFNRGKAPCDFEAATSAPWIRLSAQRGTVSEEQRLGISVDWDRAPTGSLTGNVKIAGAGAEPVVVQVRAFNPAPEVRAGVRGFVEADGYVAIEAPHFSARRDTPRARWEPLPDHGRLDSAMTIFPVTAPEANPPLDSPCLEYSMYLFSTGRVEVALLLSALLNYAPERGVSIGVSFDQAPPQILTVVPRGYVAGDGNRDWEESVKDSIRTVKSAHLLAAPGPHTLKVWMVDPGVVLQRVVVNTGGLRPSYLGPPESCCSEAARCEIGTWRGFRPAAISYTFDDGCSNQFSVAIPMFDQKGFKLTLFTAIGTMFPGWPKLEAAAAHGHEIASHTMMHVRLGSLSEEQQVLELLSSRDAIDAHISGQKCLTLAYPFCAAGKDSIASRYYLAARTCSGQLVPSTPASLMSVSSFVCGSEGVVRTAQDFNDRAESAATANSWCVYLIHGIDRDGGYSPVASATLRASLDYLGAHPDKFWVESFGNVVRYILERNAAAVKELSRGPDQITLRLADNLDDSIFNYPLTLRRPLPANWPGVRVSQNDRGVEARIVEVKDQQYVQFDVVPDAGEVILTREAR